MQVVVLGYEWQKSEWKEIPEGITWISDAGEFSTHTSADAFVDLAFEPEAERIALLRCLLPKPVLINSVSEPLAETDPGFIRFNGWNTFLSAPVWEAACSSEATKQKSEAIFALLHKTPEWLPDAPGFVTPRVVSVIINEAFLALDEGVSTKDEINTAMKLGTAYPYGPFEWGEKIGLKNIVGLLQKMSQTQPRYTPASLLVQEAFN
ncbi:MAG: hypothetical protein EOO14_01140 [Chitinophagaceae bacterium]|nr:MAG: hypothetical protein EOO14_01140 [Chitinophagaceae bacterium]